MRVWAFVKDRRAEEGGIATVLPPAFTPQMSTLNCPRPTVVQLSALGDRGYGGAAIETADHLRSPRLSSASNEVPASATEPSLAQSAAGAYAD